MTKFYGKHICFFCACDFFQCLECVTFYGNKITHDKTTIKQCQLTSELKGWFLTSVFIAYRCSKCRSRS